jgi:hypothetical protein
MKHPLFAIADELVLDRAPDLASGNVVLLSNILKLTCDCAEDLREDDGLHAVSDRVVGGRGIEEDVVGEFVIL